MASTTHLFWERRVQPDVGLASAPVPGPMLTKGQRHKSEPGKFPSGHQRDLDVAGVV